MKMLQQVVPLKSPLFNPTKVLVNEYWEKISVVVPCVDESKELKTSDAVEAYCMKCNMPIAGSTPNEDSFEQR